MDSTQHSDNIDLNDINAVFSKYVNSFAGVVGSIASLFRDNSSLDTKNFDSTVAAYKGYIKDFEDLVSDVNKICANIVDNWKGKGRDAFEKDYRQVQINLKDISEIMYELRDALAQAHGEYIKMDVTVAKSYKM